MVCSACSRHSEHQGTHQTGRLPAGQSKLSWVALLHLLRLHCAASSFGMLWCCRLCFRLYFSSFLGTAAGATDFWKFVILLIPPHVISYVLPHACACHAPCGLYSTSRPRGGLVRYKLGSLKQRADRHRQKMSIPCRPASLSAACAGHPWIQRRHTFMSLGRLEQELTVCSVPAGILRSTGSTQSV